MSDTEAEARRHSLATRRARWPWTLAGVGVYGLGALPWVWFYLVKRSAQIWQIDLEVYREGAESLISGRPVYDYLTGGPQWLPFTYPPFGAIVALPLTLVSFKAAGWIWAGTQLWLLWVSIGIAFRPLLSRWPVRAGLIQGALSAAALSTLPVAEGLRYGQVNALIVALCLVDLGRLRVGWWPRGSLVALAAAIKLTPGVFLIHWVVARRWRELRTALVTGIAVTGLAMVLVPSASGAYWFQALLDPNRLGPNNSTANQSLRALLMRLAIPEGSWLLVAWLLASIALCAAGFRLSARLDRQGHQVAVVAVCGLIAFLISPVSWAHHLYWAVVAIGVVLGDGRDRRRVICAAIGTAWLWLWFPGWADGMLTSHHVLMVTTGWFFQNYHLIWALLALLAISRFLTSPAGDVSGRNVQDHQAV